MKAKLLMIQGTSSGAGKSTFVAAICRILSNRGYRVSPFKAQNMSSELYSVQGDGIMARIQALQAMASRKAPDIRMNPILLKPRGNYSSDVYLQGRFYSTMTAADYYNDFVLEKGFPVVLESLDSLREQNDIVIIEGAGSPAEINISRYDIANMLLATKVNSPVVIVADIERGGCFASIVGTMRLLNPSQRRMVRGFIINKFLGDRSILDPAIKIVEQLTRKKILGVIPKIVLKLPAEDSLDGTYKDNNSYSEEFCNMEIDTLSDAIEKSIPIEKIKEIAGLTIRKC